MKQLRRGGLAAVNLGKLWVVVCACLWLVQVSPPQGRAEETGVDSLSGTATQFPSLDFSEASQRTSDPAAAPANATTKSRRPRMALTNPQTAVPPSAVPAASKSPAPAGLAEPAAAQTSSATSGVPSPRPSAGFQALSDNGTTFNPDTQGANSNYEIPVIKFKSPAFAYQVLGILP
jgi:hypothetical protein